MVAEVAMAVVVGDCHLSLEHACLDRPRRPPLPLPRSTVPSPAIAAVSLDCKTAVRSTTTTTRLRLQTCRWLLTSCCGLSTVTARWSSARGVHGKGGNDGARHAACDEGLEATGHTDTALLPLPGLPASRRARPKLWRFGGGVNRGAWHATVSDYLVLFIGDVRHASTAPTDEWSQPSGGREPRPSR